MLTAGEKSVKEARKAPFHRVAGERLLDGLLKIAMPAVVLAALANVGVAFHDMRTRQATAADLDRRVQEATRRNASVERLIEDLSRDPATLERWLREREMRLPGEEVLRPY
jgi:septal ring factor EnvC (AmiA/AmiB activator)